MAEQLHRPLKILRSKQVLERLGVCRSTFYGWQNSRSPQFIPDFPKAVQIGKGAVGWLDHEIEEYIESRIRLSRNHKSH